MNKIVYQLLIENKKPIIFTILGIVISIILIKLTIETSYYLAFLSFPITIIAVILLVATTIHIARTHREFISKEENLPDGSYKKYYNDSKACARILSANSSVILFSLRCSVFSGLV